MPSKSSPPRGAFSYLYEWARPYRTRYAWSVITAVLAVLASIIPYFCVGKIVTMLIEGNQNYGNYLQWIGIAAICWTVNFTLNAVSTTISHGATFTVIADVREKMCEKLAKLPMGRVLDKPSGVTKNIIVERVDSIEPTLAHLVPELTSKLAAPIIIVICVAFMDWRIALLSLITLPLGALAMMGMRSGYEEKYGRYVRSGKALNAIAVEYINGIEVIKTFGQSAKNYSKFADAANESARSAIDWMKDVQLYFSLVMVLVPSVLVSVLPASVLFYVQGSMSLEKMVLIIMLCLGIMPPLLGAMAYNDDLAKIGTIVGEINSILEDEELERPTQTAELTNFTVTGQDIHFAYADTEVLHGVNFTFKQGTVSALVGPSGSGKSTIAKLVASMWDPTSGNITIGGVDIRQIPLHQLNNLIAYVSQDTFLFNDTVRENLRKGRLDATDEEVEECAKASGCHEFIMRLDNGYDTQVGSAGGHLSGGERQRLSIARAMLKDAPIVILDEATAYTDPENEAIMQDAVARLVAGRTLIIVAHRLSTITDSDQILLINSGNVEAVGCHQQLLDSSTLYQNLWNAHIGAKDEAAV